MKRLMLVAILVGVLAMVLGTTAMAAGPNPPATPCPNCGTGVRGGMGGQRGAPSWAGLPDAVEPLLKMTDAQIRAERIAGKSLVQIAASKGVSEQELITTILNAKKAELDKLVAAGRLTQAQADTMYQQMQTQVPAMVNRTETGPAAGRGRGQGNPQGGLGLGGRWATR